MIEATERMALLNHSDVDRCWLEHIHEHHGIILLNRNRPWLTKRLRQGIILGEN